MPRDGTGIRYLLSGCFYGGGGASAQSALPAEQCQWWYWSRKRKESRGRKRENKRPVTLTTPDLVLLSLLAERPMHGYQANLELERRQARDWAGISRPQVYYSLEKLARSGLIRRIKSAEAAAGPERSVFATTAKGRAALAGALEREDWTTSASAPVSGLACALVAGAAGNV